MPLLAVAFISVAGFTACAGTTTSTDERISAEAGYEVTGCEPLGPPLPNRLNVQTFYECDGGTIGMTADDGTAWCCSGSGTARPEDIQTTISADQLEEEVAGQVGFKDGQAIENITCEGEVSTSNGSEASCTVVRPDGLEIPIVASFVDGKLRIDVPSSFSG